MSPFARASESSSASSSSHSASHAAVRGGSSGLESRSIPDGRAWDSTDPEGGGAGIVSLLVTGDEESRRAMGVSGAVS